VKSNGQALVEAYEYTAHSSVAHSYYLPVAKFHFELSPMQVGLNIFCLLPFSHVLHRLGMVRWVGITLCSSFSLFVCRFS